MLRSPFKSRGYYVFNYLPRYYDARKERFEKLKASHQNETEENKPRLKLEKNALIGQWTKAKKNMGNERQTILRMAVIISVLTGIVAYLFGLHHII